MDLSLYDLNRHIRQVIALNFGAPLWVTAEIAEANLSRGHLYLTLVQKFTPSGGDYFAEEGIVAQAQGMVWQRDLRKLAKEHGPLAVQVLAEGVQARLLVRPEYHERYGLKLQVEDIDPSFSIGALARQRGLTIATLHAEQLVERNRTLPLPPVVQRVALITSPDAAGFQDFKAHLAENSYGYSFAVQPFYAAVQGRNAEPELLAALAQIAQQAYRFDTVAIIRGGGARLDLSAFDGLALCRAVAQMPLPVLSGVGHETDESVLDLVAHTAFKTPTAVADFLIERSLLFEMGVVELAATLANIGQKQIRNANESLQFAQNMLATASQGKLLAAQRDLDFLANALPQASTLFLNNAAQNLTQHEQLLHALSPQTVLERGYTMTLKEGKIVRSAAALSDGDVLDTVFVDGTKTVTVGK
jgi:exodeoxyribonuclease VII large subunit